ncbi:MAG: hypothetical protein ACLFUB_02515 [Cyclobacteriaceae bacterium]
MKQLSAGALSCSLPVSGLFRQREKSFFHLEKSGKRWWLIDPDDKRFWSIGINHVDPATLRYADNSHIWEEKYQNSMRNWLQTVRSDLQGWGFNTLGWNQEVVTINPQNHRHSRSFTFEEYQWLDMPYCHMLPFIESHQWEIETRLPDIRSKGFEEWADYVARDHCARMKDDPKLIGYFYTDCPTWVHSNGSTRWKAPIFDPELLNTEAGKKELSDLATTYYRVLHDAVRRYDPHHLILGDRYEANHPLPEEVVRAAQPYVDVLSFQCFRGADKVAEKLGYWARLTGHPVLLGDSAIWVEPFNPKWPPPEQRHHDPAGYRATMEALWQIPESIGFHLCGAYLQNDVRNYGLKNRNDEPDMPYTAQMAEINHKMQAQVRKWRP